MPELPEVEVTRRSIDEPLRGARISAVRLGKPLRWPLGRDPQRLHGLCIGPVARRGKYLWLPLQGAPVADDDEHLPDQGLLLHLGMSGSLALHGPAPPAGGPHDHFELQTDRGTLRLTDPRLSAARISRPRAGRLLAALRQTLARALDLGGSTLRDFHDAHGLSGAFQTQAAVYGREGEACGACGTPVRRIVQSQRSTYFCPRCQRR